MEKACKLHLGCGTQRLEDWVNCDFYPGNAVDVVFDLQATWPFPDNSAVAVYASHVLEHLPDFWAFFRELWRVAVPTATVCLRVPHGGHHSAWGDVTHVRPWYAQSFCFLQPGYGDAVRNLQYDEEGPYFRIISARLIGDETAARIMRYKWLQRPFLAIAKYIPEFFHEVMVFLQPLKTPEALEQFTSTRQGNVVPVEYGYITQDKGEFKKWR